MKYINWLIKYLTVIIFIFLAFYCMKENVPIAGMGFALLVIISILQIDISDLSKEVKELKDKISKLESNKECKMIEPKEGEIWSDEYAKVEPNIYGKVRINETKNENVYFTALDDSQNHYLELEDFLEYFVMIKEK